MLELTGNVADDEFEEIIDRTEVIGKGSERSVFGVRECSGFVIKESLGPFHSANFIEWIVWTALVKMEKDITDNTPNPELQNYFCRCYAISHSARYLLMERGQKVENIDQSWISKLPSWLNDKKPSAFVITADNIIKVADYGAINFYEVLNPKNNTALF